MTWLKDLLNRLLSVLPRIHIISSFEAGVRANAFIFWYWNTPLKAGWYVWWPWFQRIFYVDIKTQVKDIRNQSVRTLDGRDIVVSGAIQYKIVNASNAILEVQNFDHSLESLALGVLLEAARKRNLDEFNNIKTLKTEVRNGITKKAEGWGLVIEEVFITDLGVARNLRLLGNGIIEKAD